MREGDAGVLGEVVLARGMDPGALARARRRGDVERVRWGAYVGARAPSGPGRDARRRVLAAIAAVHGQLTTGHWFSHESAAVLWGCDAVGLSGDVHLTQPGRPTVRTPGLVRHHGSLPPADRATVHGLPVTSLARTLVDCACALSEDRALVVADSGLRLGAGVDRVRSALAERAGRRGIARAREVLALADGRSQSPGETLLRWHLRRAGVPEPDLQVAVPTRLGLFFLDLGWPGPRVGLEFDGFVKYSGELGSTAAEAVFAEKRRQDAVEDRGWRVLRATWDDLRAPDALATRVRRALTRAPHPAL